MITNEILDTISQKIAQSYRSIYGNSIKGIFLYGSYARGDFDEESDIDYAAIIEGERLLLQEKLKRVWKDAADIGLEHDVLVSPTMIPEAEFEKYKGQIPYYRNIEREGKRIV